MLEKDILPWYTITNIATIDTPALVVFPDRIKQNIQWLTDMVTGLEWLRPHVKTHKMAEVTQLLLQAGITKFKCATIAEAEMLGQAGAPDVLLAYQPIGPKVNRLLQLTQLYPGTTFSALIDNLPVAEQLATTFAAAGATLFVFLDLNVGMNRTGIAPGPAAFTLYQAAHALTGLRPIGLHAYDGHLRAPDLAVRQATCDAAFRPVADLAAAIEEAGYPAPVVVAGGSPTFPLHLQRPGVECSPGTFVFWDYGYSQTLAEQPFQFAALVVTRIVSQLDAETLCLDLGHKAVAAECPLPRVVFLNAPDAQPIAQSEEHLVVKVPAGHAYRVGEVFYGVPVHICPTCALYEKAFVVENHTVQGTWAVIARNRQLSV